VDYLEAWCGSAVFAMSETETIATGPSTPGGITLNEALMNLYVIFRLR
jgi:hypothetical protein